MGIKGRANNGPAFFYSPGPKSGVGLCERQKLFSRPLRCYVNVKKENRSPFVFIYVSVFIEASLFFQNRELSIAPERSP